MLCKQKRERKKDQIILNVAKSKDKEKYKNNIISEFYKTGIIINKIKGIFNRHRIPYEARLEEDLNQIVFEELCKKSAHEIIEMYEDDPSRLVGLCVRIAILKGVAENGSNNPKINFTRWALYYSRLNQNNDAHSESYALECLLDEDTDLTDDEIEVKFLADTLDNQLSEEALLTLEKFREEFKNDTKQRKKASLQKYFNRRTTNKKEFGKLLIETNFIINKNIRNKPMDKQTLLIEIEKVLPVIREYHKTRKVGHLTTDDIIELKRIYDTYINPASRLMTSCAGCIKDAMDIMESFYSANKPKEVIKQEEEKPAEEKLTFEGVINVEAEKKVIPKKKTIKRK